MKNFLVLIFSFMLIASTADAQRGGGHHGGGFHGGHYCAPHFRGPRIYVGPVFYAHPYRVWVEGYWTIDGYWVPGYWRVVYP